jgi:maltooligosyltrehalose synthase
VLTVVPRLYARLLGDRDALPLGPAIWGDTAIELPRNCGIATLRNELDGASLQPQEHDGRHFVLASKVFASFPVALLSGTSPG